MKLSKELKLERAQYITGTLALEQAEAAKARREYIYDMSNGTCDGYDDCDDTEERYTPFAPERLAEIEAAERADHPRIRYTIPINAPEPVRAYDHPDCPF